MDKKRSYRIKPKDCISTHGGAGYIAGAFIKDDKVVCPACGTECEINRYALGDHVEGTSEYKESLKPKKKFLRIF